MIPALNDSAIVAGLLFNTVIQTDDLQQRPKWTLIVSLKQCSWQEDIHHVTKRVVYFCYNGLHQQVSATVYWINRRLIHGPSETDYMKHLSSSHSLDVLLAFISRSIWADNYAVRCRKELVWGRKRRGWFARSHFSLSLGVAFITISVH